MDIKTVRQRSNLTPRREPYWSLIGTGQHIGYRVTETGGHWIARAYDAGTRQRAYRSFGDLSSIPDADRFTAAVREARKWFDHVEQGGQSDVATVAAAFERYIEHQDKRKGKAAASDARSRFKRHVEHDQIAHVELIKLASRHLDAWRERVAQRPALADRRGPNSKLKTAPAIPRARSPATLKRDLVAMRAALNLALLDGYVASDMAWRKSLEPPKEMVHGRRENYLTRKQRQHLLTAIKDAHLHALAKALCLLPLRPGALAAARVADFDSRHKVLTVRSDKARAGRKVPLSLAAAEVFRECAKSKLPAALLFTRADGKAWTKNDWRLPFREACNTCELGPEITLYALRHSTITDLVTDGMDLASVADISGTSIDMIQKNYAHLQADRARDALAGLAL